MSARAPSAGAEIRNDKDEPRGAEAILHPVMMASIAILLINDHILKEHIGGVVTGKLSDLAGLSYFPVLLYGVFITLLPVRRSSARVRRGALLTAASVTALVFAAIKTIPAATQVYCVGLGLLQWPL
jgi:hypothetical protein